TAVADSAVELEALVDALEINRFVVLGYSGGAPYALAVAHGLAHRVDGAVVVAGAGEIGEWATLKDLARSDRQLTWLALHTPAVARAVLRVGDIGARVAPRLSLRSVATEMPKSDRRVLGDFASPQAALEMFTSAVAHRAAG